MKKKDLEQQRNPMLSMPYTRFVTGAAEHWVERRNLPPQSKRSRKLCERPDTPFSDTSE